MERNVRFVIPVVALVFLAGDCSKEGPSGPAEPDVVRPLLPLAVGNSWIYSITQYSDTGSVTGLLMDTVRIIDSVELDGEIWYHRFQSRQAQFSLQFPLGMSNREDGVYMRWLFDTSLVPFLIYRYPAMVGDSFYVGDQNLAMVTATSIPLLVNNVEYQAWEYKQSSPDGSARFLNFLAPKIGLVREDILQRPTVGGDLVLNERSDLVQYELK